MNKVLILLLSAGLVAGCASTTESGAVGVQRKQFMLGVSADQVNDMSLKGYEELKTDAKKKGTLDKNSAQLQRVTEISKRLIPFVTVFRKDAAGWPWEVHVITSDE